MWTSGLTLLSGNAVAAVLLLLRNLLIAVLIPVSDYGIAATFAIAMAVVEMATDLGLHQQIIQSHKGENARFQAALQGFQVLRGLLAGLILLLAAPFIAHFLGVPHVSWAFQTLAIVPALNGFQHFDLHRMQREMQFRPLAIVKVVPALLSFLCVWPLAILFGDYRVMLVAILVQMTTTLVGSHVIAKRGYKLVFDVASMRESLAFGWPLLVGGALLFVVFQGDKIIVARTMGMESLALLAMGLTLTLTPMMVLAKSLQTFFLPQLSRADGRFPILAQVSQETAIFAGVLFLSLVGLIAPLIVAAVLGPKYAALEPLLIWLALMQAVRIAKVGPSVVALSQGVTTVAMWSNGARVAVLPFAWWAAVQGADLLTLLWIGLVGELIGYAIGLGLMVRATGLSVSWGPQLALLAILIITGLSAFVDHPVALTLTFIGGPVVCGLTCIKLRAHLRTGAQSV